MSSQKKTVTKSLNKPTNFREVQRDEQLGRTKDIASEAAVLSVDDENVLYLCTSSYFYAQDNPGVHDSPTLRRVHHEYLRRLREIIEHLNAGESWQQQCQNALIARQMGEILYSQELRPSEDDLLVWFSTHGKSTKQAREIIIEMHAGQKHRPKDKRVWLGAFSDYDLVRSGKKISRIIHPRYGRRCNRTEIERIRQRVKRVEKLLNECGLAL